jgi:chemotaxis protein CheY-P-specific phosphatase CheC
LRAQAREKGALFMQVAIEQDQSTIHHQICLLPQEIERLYEAAQVGASNALNSLRDFLGMQAEIHLNCLSFMPLPILIDRIRLFYPEHIAFHLRFSGEISGEIYTFFQERDALILIQQMMGSKKLKNNKSFNRVEISVLTELVNILSSSFWRSLTEKASLNWWFTPPSRISDLQRVLNYSAKIYNLDHLLVHFEYLIQNLEIRVQLVMLPTKSTMKKILAKLNPLPFQEIE